ncbi:MAG: LCP family protein, partial [Kiritimatiellae bacterium]|nr:LCP family protein [Kiritimatiellia bacterium]
GVEESMATLEKEFGITLHYYARVNFTSLIKIVNALGGINVYNDQSFTSYHTHDYYPKGEMYMDGETALEFVRERYGLANGDHDRVKNQQKVLTAMLKKAMSPSIIKNYGKLMDAVSGSFTTNMDAKEIQSLIQMQVDDMASWNFEQISVNGTGTKSTSCYSMPGQSVYVMKPDYDTVNNAIERINSVLRGE